MKFTIALKVVSMAAFFFWTTGIGPDLATGSEYIDVSAFKKTIRPRVLFDHDAHNETADLDECGSCHHVWEGGKQVEDESSEDQSCSDCHSLKPGSGNKISLVNAFHIQCRSCHFEGNKGPVLCGQCHRKIRRHDEKENNDSG